MIDDERNNNNGFENSFNNEPDNNANSNSEQNENDNQQSSAYVVEGNDYFYGEQPTQPSQQSYNQNVQQGYNQNAQQNPQNPPVQTPPQYSNYSEYSQQTVNSMSYDPNADKKGQKQRRVLTAIISVCCVLAIVATCVIGYNLISPGNIGTATSTTTSDSSQAETTESNSTEEESTTNEDKELPTIYQLSAPEDAMTIPDIVDQVSDSIVGISCIFSNGTGSGTGIIMSEDGYILTNAHVVSNATSVQVVFADDSDNGIDAEIIGIDSQTDIAVIKIDQTGLTPVEFGKSSELRVGEAAIVIGNPLSQALANTVTSGIISALDRELTIEDKTLTLIQTDAAINSGNSGGALLNAYGQVVGITSAKISSTYGENLGFAIPIDDALPIAEELIENGYVTGRPLLGISGSDISEFYSEYYGIPQGFQVVSVESGSAAEEAGIEVGDVIVGIEGQLITSIDEFNEIKNTYSAGDTITISLYRDGSRIDIEVTLGEATAETTTEDTTEATTNSSFNWGY
ncbi:MAG: trypsin-like peptidase domain-containing protein [Ruminococcus sp.]|nr:trypsin-like peptidase domain-containing protein [Ruminococcus sp.]